LNLDAGMNGSNSTGGRATGRRTIQSWSDHPQDTLSALQEESAVPRIETDTTNILDLVQVGLPSAEVEEEEDRSGAPFGGGSPSGQCRHTGWQKGIRSESPHHFRKRFVTADLDRIIRVDCALPAD
jgi:hypothetical protein